MRRILLSLCFLLFLVPAFGLGFQDLEGTWRVGERGYFQVSYVCAGSEKTLPYSLEISFSKSEKTNVISGTGLFEFERFEFTAQITKNSQIDILAALRYSSRIKTFQIKLKKENEKLVGTINGVINCGKGIKSSTFTRQIYLLQKPTNSLKLTLLQKVPASANPKVVKFIGNETVLFGTDFGTVGLVNCKTGAASKETAIQPMRAITDLVISQKLSKVFVASYNGLDSVFLESQKGTSLVLRADKHYNPPSQPGLVPFRIDAIELSPEEDKLLVAANGGIVLNTTDLQEVSRVKNPTSNLSFVGFSKQNRVVTVNTSGEIFVETSSANELIQTTPNSYVWSAQLSADKSLLALGSTNIQIYDFSKKKLIANLVGHANPVTGLSFSHNGTYLASASEESFRVWNLKTGKQIWTSGVSGGSDVAFSPDDKIITFVGGGRILSYSLPSQ